MEEHQARCNEIQVLKFGQLIDLEMVDKVRRADRCRCFHWPAVFALSLCSAIVLGTHAGATFDLPIVVVVMFMSYAVISVVLAI